MDAKEYVARYKAYEDAFDAINALISQLSEEYYSENEPYPEGTVVDVFFNDGSKLRGAVVGKWEVDHTTGEFRPNLCKVSKEGSFGKRLYYPWKLPIDRIEKVCSLPTCNDCIWRRKTSDGRTCCNITMDGEPGAYRMAEVNPCNTMCGRGVYVRWDGDMPWKQKFKITKEK